MTRVGEGDFSTPVKVTVISEKPDDDNSTTSTPATQLTNKNDDVLYSFSVLPSLIIVSVAVTVFSLLYYRR